MDTSHSWAVDRPMNTAFAVPTGLAGRAGGWLMARTNRPHQDNVLGLLELRPGGHVLEVGYGPGRLVRRLLATGLPARVVGVDPSAEMRGAARRANRRAVAAGRADLRLGTAAETGLADASVDTVVSVNNVPIWPDLDAGIRELHRVLRPGGQLLLAWHSAAAPAPIVRRLALPEDKLVRIATTLGASFGSVTRHERSHTVVFDARR